MIIGKEYFMQRKTPILIALLLLILGSIVYFSSGASDNSGTMDALKSTNNSLDATPLLTEDINIAAPGESVRGVLV